MATLENKKQRKLEAAEAGVAGENMSLPGTRPALMAARVLLDDVPLWRLLIFESMARSIFFRAAFLRGSGPLRPMGDPLPAVLREVENFQSNVLFISEVNAVGGHAVHQIDCV